MMKTIHLLIPSPGTSAISIPIPMKDPCRLVSCVASVGVSQSTNASPMSLGKNGAATTILSVDFANKDALKGYEMAFTGSLTEGNKNQIFDKNTPLVFTVDLHTASSIGLAITVDPFVIGPHKGPDTVAS